MSYFLAYFSYTDFSVVYYVFLHSRVTGACPVTTDLLMRVDVRTTKRHTQYSYGF